MGGLPLRRPQPQRRPSVPPSGSAAPNAAIRKRRPNAAIHRWPTITLAGHAPDQVLTDPADDSDNPRLPLVELTSCESQATGASRDHPKCQLAEYADLLP
jgi:hypothetical protein